jgi:hypothetical protein
MLNKLTDSVLAKNVTLGFLLIILSLQISVYAGPLDCYILLARNPGPIIDFAIENSVPASWQQSIIAAAKTWNNINASIKFNLTPNPNSLNRITVQSLGQGGPLAISNSPDRLCSRDGQTLGLCMVINSDYSWSAEPNKRPSKPLIADVQGVVTHEFGHWLGLDDIPIWKVFCRSIMKAVVPPSNTYQQRFLTRSDIEFIKKTYPNTPPIANAGPDQTVQVGSPVQLDGSGSSDPDGDTLRYTWRFISRPAGSRARLSDQRSAKPTFTPDKEGEYVLELTVDDGRGEEAKTR